MIAPTLGTERLTLRAYMLEDFEPFRALWISDEAKHMGGPLPSADAAWNMFCSDIAHWQLLGFGYWALEERSSGALVGVVGISKPPSFAERELGWHLYAPHRGKGYATEAARAARDYAFGTLGWDTLVSYISLDNSASIAVAKRLGAAPDPAAAFADGDTAADTVVYRHPASSEAQGRRS
jgi:RimJ/RimL family protein N-acetyltransferase